MHKRYPKILLLVISAAFLGWQQVSADIETVVLKEQYRAGQSFNQVDLTQYRIGLSEGTDEVWFNTSVAMGYVCQITKAAPSGSWSAKMKINSVYYEAPEVLGRGGFYDSSQLTALPDQNTAILSYLVGDEIEMEMGAKGTLEELKFSDAFIKKVGRYFRSNELNLNPEAVETLVTETFKSNLTKEADSPQQGVFPTKPVAVGDSWEKQTTSEKNGWKFTFKILYTLKQHQNGVACVEIRSQLMEADSVSENPYKLVNPQGEMKGVIEVMEDSGWLRAYDIQLKFAGEVRTAESKNRKDNSGEEGKLEGKFTLEGSTVRRALPLE